MAKEKEAVMNHLGKEKPGKKKESKHHTHGMTVKRADHGGFHITHHMKDEQGNDAPDQTAVGNDIDDATGQMNEAMGDQPAAGEGTPQEPQPQAPQPQQGM